MTRLELQSPVFQPKLGAAQAPHRPAVIVDVPMLDPDGCRLRVDLHDEAAIPPDAGCAVFLVRSRSTTAGVLPAGRSSIRAAGATLEGKRLPVRAPESQTPNERAEVLRIASRVCGWRNVYRDGELVDCSLSDLLALLIAVPFLGIVLKRSIAQIDASGVL